MGKTLNNIYKDGYEAYHLKLDSPFNESILVADNPNFPAEFIKREIEKGFFKDRDAYVVKVVSNVIETIHKETSDHKHLK